MNSSTIVYVDNSYLGSSKKLLWVSPKLASSRGRNFHLGSFALPALLTLVGLVLIAISFTPVFFVSQLKATQLGSYPTANNKATPAKKDSVVAIVSKVVTEEEIKTAAADFTVADIPRLNLSSARAWPVRGRITTYYSSYHPGIDIATAYGTPIHPFMEGVVTKAGYSTGGVGNEIIIHHSDGFETMYAHLSVIKVAVGDKVEMGTVIGLIGSTGNATGPHLHFQVSQDGQTINPLSVLP